ncbi:MAG: HNH endonuclease [Gulosibacter sp.]|uniref:HNH endonuclease signature motif containing protein n=1 Tax=Gulosibacter sp. TaxID=2817531 RepID=UPI003F912AAA
MSAQDPHRDDLSPEDGKYLDRGSAISGNDDLRIEELEATAARYIARKQRHGALVADDLEDLAVAFSIATARADADRQARAKRAWVRNADYFPWHLRSVMGEFALPTHESDVTLQNRAYEAEQLVNDYPAWVDAIRAGRVTLRHARAFLRDTRALDAELLSVLAERVLAYAVSHTVAQTTAFVDREIATIAADNFEAVHNALMEERDVTVTPEGFGMSTLRATLPTELAVGIDRQLTLDARTIRDRNVADAKAHTAAVRAAAQQGLPAPAPFEADSRTVAQIRADVLCEMLLCGDPASVSDALTTSQNTGAGANAGAMVDGSRVTATVGIVIPVLSLLDDAPAEDDTTSASRKGASDNASVSSGSASGTGSSGRRDGRVAARQPALVDGRLPISLNRARQLAAGVPSVQRILTDPITGHTITVDSYRPDASLRRFLQVRDRSCRFPGCTRPALGADLDHTVPFSEGGATSEHNLAALCRGHHVQKHQRRWQMRQLGGGEIEWTTPLGYQTTTEPEPLGPVFRAKPEPPGDGRPGDVPPPF